MELIKKLDIRINKSGNKESYGEFYCTFCKLLVERPLSYKNCKSCGCVKYKLASESRTGIKQSLDTVEKRRLKLIGKKRTEIQKENISKAKKGKPSHNKGKLMSEDQKQKIRLANTGKKRTEETKQKIRGIQLENSWNRNKIGVYSELTLQKMSDSHKNYWTSVESYEHRQKFIGQNNPNWNNGSSFEPYAPEFNKGKKQFILERDNYTCQTPNCINTENLHIHHIDYDKKNNLDENLITLCISCHMKTNSKNKRQYFTEFYNNLINERMI